MKIKFGTNLKKLKTKDKYLVCYIDHYEGNSKGFFIETKSVKELPDCYLLWHRRYDDRGIVKAFTTSEDVPGIIKRRKEIIEKIRREEHDSSEKLKAVPYIDGRFTKKSKPELFKERDLIKENNRKVHTELDKKRNLLQKELKKLPYYSTTLFDMKEFKITWKI
ncbi:MAG TPA: hypothetical protein PK495_08380 [Bacteroidales bacterium]|nr:hypothetical protein [Bacteroidales bacterium]